MRVRLTIAVLAAFALLAGCQFTLPRIGGDRTESVADTAAANPISGDAITTAKLAPAGAGSAAATPAVANGAPPAPPGAAAGGTGTGNTGTATDAPTADATTAETPPEAEVPPPPVIKSPAQLACEKRGGRWMTVGGTNTQSCITMTRDSGKSCSRKTDCQGQCLARSRTCAPAEPLFGCNEVLEPNGVRATLCID